MFGIKKKGQMADLSGFALTMGTVAIVLVVVFVILANLGTNSAVGTGTYAANATSAVQSALYGLVGWLPIIVVAFVGGIVLMLVIKQFSKGG